MGRLILRTAGRRAGLRPLPLLLVPLILWACPGPESWAPTPSNILLLTVDTLRADHLSCHGYPRQTSPVIDGLAAEGVRFAAASVQWPKTGPSFASLFTATYPKDNGIVRRVGVRLPGAFRMLAEELGERGYESHAVVANGALGRNFNFQQGFETYIETWKLDRQETGGDPTQAEVVTDLAITVAAELSSGAPWFLWVHYLDPHFPYTPPEPWAGTFVGDRFYDDSTRVPVSPGVSRRQMGGIGAKQVLDDRTEMAYYVASYDEEILYADAQIGRLLEHLRERGLMERTLTVFTSDHGESLGEHNYYFDHGRFGFQTCLHVPLILHYPGVLEPRVDEEPVELLDLAPTLLEAAGAELEDGTWMQGRSLAPRLTGRADTDRVRYARSEAGYATRRRWQKIVRDERYKLYFAPYHPDQRWVAGRGEQYALYDLEEDPGETVDRKEEEPEVFQRLRTELFDWYEFGSFDVLVDEEETPAEVDDGMDEETREQLRALGYID